MAGGFYGVYFDRNSPIAVSTEDEQTSEIVVDDVQTEEESPLVNDNEIEESQEINVYAGSVIPELPKVLDNEQINVYVPIAGETFPGIAFFNPEHFHIAVNGFVSLLKGGIEKIEKVKSENGVDTWGVFLTDGRVEYFTITNGKPGLKGDTPILKVQDNELYASYDAGDTWNFLAKLPEGPEGPKGDGFEIKKVYTSVEEMNSNFETDGVPLGGFVLISTDDVNDNDNSKLYVKGEDSYRYLNDLSGAQGIQGPPGQTPVKGVDYYTESEKEAFIKDVINEIPFAEGVSV